MPFLNCQIVCGFALSDTTTCLPVVRSLPSRGSDHPFRARAASRRSLIRVDGSFDGNIAPTDPTQWRPSRHNSRTGMMFCDDRARLALCENVVNPANAWQRRWKNGGHTRGSAYGLTTPRTPVKSPRNGTKDNSVSDMSISVPILISNQFGLRIGTKSSPKQPTTQ